MAHLSELEAIRKSQILDAAVRTIADKGSTNVRMDDIARRSGLSKGGIAYYFSSKESLIKAAFTAHFESVFEAVSRELDREPSVFARLARIHLLFDREREEVGTGYPLIADFMYQAMHHPEYRPLFAGWVEGCVALLTGTLQEGMDQGLFIGMDPEPVARSISAIYQGVGQRWFLAPETHPRAWALTTLEYAVMGVLVPFLAPGVELTRGAR
ncbi:TetR/AcrR family transcriptional regulator [Desulfoluna spongiiphila]|uniref:Transcriptional regulator, TetR family n=1 Tax=Desulfoluna spongiiphila TaxID=419481 RepID=A0A1G5GAV5_9BACT|nr:TetR/AcrR family transcriptional regulator [Desulfoluna spongiiphila]SCY48439.1 transcriptional regulator, TetR family [Desulfoluna spongiiphila]